MKTLEKVHSIYFKIRLQLWKLKGMLPFVKKKEYIKLMDLYSQSMKFILNKPSMATDAQMVVIHESLDTEQIFSATEEICLFVSFAPDNTIKPHVIHHLRALYHNKIAIILIINTDKKAEDFILNDEVLALCSRVCIRQNKGFDFAAWAHAALRFEVSAHARRIYLINDSIVGPISMPPFEVLLNNIRKSDADVISLTENWSPCWHLQSFFLVFQNAILSKGAFDTIMQAIQNLPTKDLVIDCYETHLSTSLKKAGYRCEAIFCALNKTPYRSDDVHRNWENIVDRGFPYIKASIVKKYLESSGDQRIIPKEILDIWNKNQ